MEDWEELSKEEFAEYVENMREAAGLTQFGLGKLMGLSAATIKAYENPAGKRMPRDMFTFMLKLQEVCTTRIREKRERKKKEAK